MHCIHADKRKEFKEKYIIFKSAANVKIRQNLDIEFFHHDDVFSYIYMCVTYRLIARQRLGKDILASANARSNRKAIVRQRISKQAFSTIERLCFLRGPCGDVIKGQRKSFEWRCYQEMGRVLQMAV
jgi:hypothetical protein